MIWEVYDVVHEPPSKICILPGGMDRLHQYDDFIDISRQIFIQMATKWVFNWKFWVCNGSVLEKEYRLFLLFLFLFYSKSLIDWKTYQKEGCFLI